MKLACALLLAFVTLAQQQHFPFDFRGGLPMRAYYLEPWNYYNVDDAKSLYNYLVLKSILRYYQQLGNKPKVQPTKESVTIVGSPLEESDGHEIFEFDGESRTTGMGRFRTQVMERIKEPANPRFRLRRAL